MDQDRSFIDPSTDKGRIVASALKLAAERPWSQVSMRDIAQDAGLTLDVLRKSVGSKTQIVAIYLRMVDDEVLKRVPGPDASTSARDALFEILMARFDAMAPHKAALRSISRDTTLDSTLMGSFLNSQRWMLMAAGLDGDGPRGVMRSAGLASLFGSVFRIWLDDEDQGLGPTMAALDRRLRRAEATMSSIDGVFDGLKRFGDAVAGGMSRGRTRRPDTDPPPAAAGASGDDSYGAPGAPPTSPPGTWQT